MFSNNWQVGRDIKIAQRQAAIDSTTKLMGEDSITTYTVSEEDLEILSTDAVGIVEAIQAGKWTSTIVLKAYIRRAIKVQTDSNPLTEILFEEALEIAGKMDVEFAKTGKVVGRLHGVPISLKDQYSVKGCDVAIGCTQDINKPSEEDCTLVEIVRSEGGIPFCKTNIPQTMMAFECGNPLGTTSNPYDNTRSPGGSSGGEACLIGSDGTALGFGSDIGGSVRIPAHYSGCFSLKLCVDRYPEKGIKDSDPGFEAVRGVLGPMSRSVRDLALACRIMFDQSVPLSRTLPIPPLPYREVVLPKKLKFGYYYTDGFCRASPVCSRAITETVDALRREGHEVIEITPYNPIEAMEVFVALNTSGGLQTLMAGTAGDPSEQSLKLTLLGVSLPWFVRNMASAAVGYWCSDPQMATLISVAKEKTVTETQAYQYKRTQFIAKFREEVWGKFALDGIICAPQATPALRIGEANRLSSVAIATILYNIVDSAVGLVPVTFCRKDDIVTEEWRQQGVQGSKLTEDAVYGPGGVYDPVAMEGLPVGIQLVGACWEEEKVLKMMEIVHNALGPRGFSPGDFVKRKQQK